MDMEEVIAAKYQALEGGLTESVRQRGAAAEARALGRGGATRVSRATGVSLPTIRKGIREMGEGLKLVGVEPRHSGKAAQHWPDHAQIDERFAGFPLSLVVSGQTPFSIQPPERALHDPALGMDHEPGCGSERHPFQDVESMRLVLPG